QQGVSSAKVLIVGAGGLGCPVAMYLAGAGVHTIGIVDYDEVAIDNLHRQVAHKESMIGKPKVESLRETVNEYLLNDACVLLGKPLVSGSALRWEGQLTVYNYTDESGE
ncbi:ThiF family protein, partial [Teladorsagia circumcincta]